MQLLAASQIASHITPLGKTGMENPDAPDLSDEDDGMAVHAIQISITHINFQLWFAANDDSDDTESHDEEDDEEIVGNHTMEAI